MEGQLIWLEKQKPTFLDTLTKTMQYQLSPAKILVLRGVQCFKVKRALFKYTVSYLSDMCKV